MGGAKSSGGWLVWVAQGFGSGRMPVAPGTWGTLPGIAVTAGLLMSGHLLWYFLGAVLLVVVAVPLCGYAERAMGEHDPSSVVFDEIVAVPWCYAGWVWVRSGEGGVLPGVGTFLAGGGWWWVLVGFVVFRILDALKPWPIGVCQKLPGGWGVVADDVVAGLITGLVVWVGTGP